VDSKLKLAFAVATIEIPKLPDFNLELNVVGYESRTLSR
jgi:hypothetical protein